MDNIDHTKKNTIALVEWTEDKIGDMAWRFPSNGLIQYGAKLIVRDHQQAIFLAGSEFADIYNPGLFTLVKENMMRFSIFNRWESTYHAPFSADIFFIKTKFFIEQAWWLEDKVQLADHHLDASGTFDVKIINARRFLQKIALQQGTFSTSHASKMVSSIIQNLLPSAVEQLGISMIEDQRDSEQIANFIQESINIEFNDYGLLLRNLTLKSALLKTESV